MFVYYLLLISLIFFDFFAVIFFIDLKEKQKPFLFSLQFTIQFMNSTKKKVQMFDVFFFFFCHSSFSFYVNNIKENIFFVVV